jgi:hypothetical protein
MMILEVTLSGNRLVELEGDSCSYWTGSGFLVYQGDIDGLPESVIRELLDLGAIREKACITS